MDKLRLARETADTKAYRQFDANSEARVAPIARTAGFAAVGAAATGGYALARGAQKFSEL